jgi:hypothetical protein
MLSEGVDAGRGKLTVFGCPSIVVDVAAPAGPFAAIRRAIWHKSGYSSCKQTKYNDRESEVHGGGISAFGQGWSAGTS